MKRKLRFVISIFIILLGCTKDFDGQIIDSFEFSFSGRNDTEGYVYQELNTSFSITPTKEIKNAKFFFDYVISEGDGYFIDDNGNVYNGEEIELQKLVWNYSYVPTEIGKHKILFKAKDYRDNEVELELGYDVEFAPFTAILKSGTNKYIVNKRNELLLILLSENTSRELDSIYTVKYSVDGGLGTVYRDSMALEIGEDIDFKGGNSEISYMPETLGEHTISMVCTSPDGFEKKVSQVIEVDNTTFFMSADPVNTFGSVGSDFRIIVVLQTTDASDEVDYEMSYYFADDSEGAGTLKNELDETLVPATGYAIEPGDHELSFNAEIAGEKKLYFDISDSNNQIKRDSVVFDYVTGTFDLSASTPNEDIALNVPVAISFDLSGEQRSESYSMSYTKDNGNGKLSDDNGSEILPSEVFPVAEGNWIFNYIPTTLGDNSLVFSVTDGFGQTREVTVDFNVGDSFGFSLISDKNTYDIEEGAEIIFNVDGTDSYTATYSSDNDGVLTYGGSSYPAGTPFEIEKGTSKGSYQAFGTGNHALEFTVVSPNQESRSGGISFSYNEVDTSVDFSVDAQTDIALVGETVGLEFGLNGNETYTAQYSNTNQGVLVYDGNNIAPGQSFTISQGSSSGTYTGNSNGGHALSFTVTSDTGVEIFATETVTFTSPVDDTITFNANQDSNSATVGQTVGINFTLGGDETYTARYTNTSSGNLVYEGSTIEPGSEFTIVKGNSLARYAGSSSGTHNLSFTVTSDTGASASDVASVAYDVPIDTAITFSADESNGSAEVGNSVDIDFSLTGNETYTATYINDNVGVFVYDGTTIGEGQTFVISQGSSTATYMGTATGSHDINFTVTSDSGEIASDNATIVYNETVDTDISFSVDVASDTSTLGTGVDIDFELSGNETYTAAYSNSSSGSFEYGGTTVNPGDTFAIERGASSGKYSGSESGDHDLNFIVTSDTGATASDGASITFEETVDSSIVFNVNEFDKAAEVGASVDILFELTGNETYSVTYSNNSTGTFTYNGQSVNPGDAFDIGTGSSSAVYVGTASGEHNLEFTVSSDTGASDSDSAQITFSDVTDTTIVFSADQGADTAEVGEEVNIDFELAGDESYTVTYTNDNTGSLIYDGSTIDPGETFSISLEASSGIYSGTASGEHNLNFTVVSDTGTSVSDAATITFNVPVDASITFSANGSVGTANVGQTVAVDFSLTGDETYVMAYTNSNSGTFVYDGSTIEPGDSFTIAVGDSSGTYTGSANGDHDVNFTVTSGSGATASDTVSIAYTTPVDTTISFNADPDRTDATTGENVNIVFDLSGDESYTATYTNSSSGTFVYNSDQINPGDSFIIVTGSSTGIYNSTNEGAHNLGFTVTSNTGATASDNLGITYSDAVDTTISFSSVPANGSADVGEAVGIDFDLTGDEEYTASYSNSNTGTFTYGGTTISTGDTFTITKGTSSGSYTGSANGVHTIEFTVVSDSGVSDSDSANITYSTPVDTTISFSANAATGTADVGETVGIDFNLSGDETYTTTYTNSNTGTLVYNGDDISPGTSFTVTQGSSSANYTGSSEGVHELEFTATSNTGVTSSDGTSIAYDVSTLSVTGVSVAPSTATIDVGNTTTLSSTVEPSNATVSSVSWSSSNTGVATVSSSGVVTGVSTGTATITVITTDGGFNASSAITINAATAGVTGVSVSPTTLALDEGNMGTLSATVSPSNATVTSVTWASSDTGVATVSSSGVVTGISAGTATITVTTTDGGFTATSTITVNAATVDVTGVSVSPTSATVVEGNNTSLLVTVSPSNATVSSVTWASSNSGVATVNSRGVVTGVSAGTATITVTTTDGGFTATSAITVNAATVDVTGVSVSPTTLALNEGNTGTLSATVSPSNATVSSIAWSSSNTGVATVSSSGIVTGVSAGNATITVITTDGGFTATSAITVNVPTVDVTGVSVSPTSVSVAEGSTTTISESIAPSNATNQSVSWSSSNTGIATVNSSGVVTGVSPGPATITVTTTDGGFTATSSITVTAVPPTGFGLSVLPVSDVQGFSGQVGDRLRGTIKVDTQGDYTVTVNISGTDQTFVSFGRNTVLNTGQTTTLSFPLAPSFGLETSIVSNTLGTKSVTYTVTSVATGVTETATFSAIYTSEPSCGILSPYGLVTGEFVGLGYQTLMPNPRFYDWEVRFQKVSGPAGGIVFTPITPGEWPRSVSSATVVPYNEWVDVNPPQFNGQHFFSASVPGTYTIVMQVKVKGTGYLYPCQLSFTIQ